MRIKRRRGPCSHRVKHGPLNSPVYKVVPEPTDVVNAPACEDRAWEPLRLPVASNHGSSAREFPPEP